MKLLSLVTLSLGICVFLSCKKNDHTAAGKLKEVALNNGSLVEMYSYDENGRLKELITGGMEMHTNVFTYSNGRIAEIVVSSMGFSSRSPFSFKQKFNYNANRLESIQIEKISPYVAIDPDEFYPGRYEFIYTDQSDRYSSYILHYKNATTEKPVLKYDFTYDGNGNLKQADHYSYSSSGWSVPLSYSYEYGNVRNPHYQNVHPVDFERFISRDFWISKHRLNPPAGVPSVETRICKRAFSKLYSSKTDRPGAQECFYKYY